MNVALAKLTRVSIIARTCAEYNICGAHAWARAGRCACANICELLLPALSLPSFLCSLPSVACKKTNLISHHPTHTSFIGCTCSSIASYTGGSIVSQVCGSSESCCGSSESRCGSSESSVRLKRAICAAPAGVILQRPLPVDCTSCSRPALGPTQKTLCYVYDCFVWYGGPLAVVRVCMLM